MRSTTPHIGAEPSVGPKTVVVGFPRVVVECLLALTERARGGAAAVEDIQSIDVFPFWFPPTPREIRLGLDRSVFFKYFTVLRKERRKQSKYFPCVCL